MNQPPISELEKLMVPPVDRDHMQAWIQKFLGFTLPDCRVTKYADSTPADFVWEVFQCLMQGKALHIMALSGRDSSKTVSLSVIDLFSMLFDQRSAIHLGMTKAQAQRAREYLEKYILKQEHLRSSVVKQNNSEIRLKIGQEDVGLELISMSPKAVQGAHYSLVSYDELASSTDPMHVKAYRDSSGIAGTSAKGKPAVIVKITSRQTGDSIPEIEIKNAKKSGIKIVKWTTIDCMKQCPPERSGTQPLPMWINIIKGEKYTDDEWAKLPQEQKQGDFERTEDTMNKCYSCPLAVYCQGRARFQTSTSVLLREIDDVITKVNSSGSHDWVLSQIMSLQPSSEGLVYFEFKRSVHIPGWEAMWETLTGDKPSHPVTRELWIAKAKRVGVTFYGGIDWGWSSPSTCVVIAVDRKDNVYVVEAFGATYKSDPEFIIMIKNQIQPKYNIQMYAPDSAQQGSIKDMRNNDLPAAEIDKGPGTVKEGINVLKRFLRVPGTNSAAKLFIAPDVVSNIQNVPGLVDEFEMYKKQTDVTGRILDDENPEGENDHYLDALRYILFWLFAKATAKAVFADPLNQGQGVATADMPMEQIAQVQGVKFNDNRGDFDQMGAQDDPDDDPNGTPGGGGLIVEWT